MGEAEPGGRDAVGASDHRAVGQEPAEEAVARLRRDGQGVDGVEVGAEAVQARLALVGATVGVEPEGDLLGGVLLLLLEDDGEVGLRRREVLDGLVIRRLLLGEVVAGGIERLARLLEGLLCGVDRGLRGLHVGLAVQVGEVRVRDFVVLGGCHGQELRAVVLVLRGVERALRGRLGGGGDGVVRDCLPLVAAGRVHSDRGRVHVGLGGGDGVQHGLRLVVGRLGLVVVGHGLVVGIGGVLEVGRRLVGRVLRVCEGRLSVVRGGLGGGSRGERVVIRRLLGGEVGRGGVELREGVRDGGAGAVEVGGRLVHVCLCGVDGPLRVVLGLGGRVEGVHGVVEVAVGGVEGGLLGGEVGLGGGDGGLGVGDVLRGAGDGIIGGGDGGLGVGDGLVGGGLGGLLRLQGRRLGGLGGGQGGELPVQGVELAVGGVEGGLRVVHVCLCGVDRGLRVADDALEPAFDEGAVLGDRVGGADVRSARACPVVRAADELLDGGPALLAGGGARGRGVEAEARYYEFGVDEVQVVADSRLPVHPGLADVGVDPLVERIGVVLGPRPCRRADRGVGGVAAGDCGPGVVERDLLPVVPAGIGGRGGVAREVEVLGDVPCLVGRRGRLDRDVRGPHVRLAGMRVGPGRPVRVALGARHQRVGHEEGVEADGGAAVLVAVVEPVEGEPHVRDAGGVILPAGGRQGVERGVVACGVVPLGRLVGQVARGRGAGRPMARVLEEADGAGRDGGLRVLEVLLCLLEGGRRGVEGRGEAADFGLLVGDFRVLRRDGRIRRVKGVLGRGDVVGGGGGGGLGVGQVVVRLGQVALRVGEGLVRGALGVVGVVQGVLGGVHFALGGVRGALGAGERVLRGVEVARCGVEGGLRAGEVGLCLLEGGLLLGDRRIGGGDGGVVGLLRGVLGGLRVVEVRRGGGEGGLGVREVVVGLVLGVLRVAERLLGVVVVAGCLVVGLLRGVLGSLCGVLLLLEGVDAGLVDARIGGRILGVLEGGVRVMEVLLGLVVGVACLLLGVGRRLLVLCGLVECVLRVVLGLLRVVLGVLDVLRDFVVEVLLVLDGLVAVALRLVIVLLGLVLGVL